MNPLKWNTEAKVSLAIFTIVGGVFGFVYFYVTRGSGIHYGDWIEFGYFGASDEVLFGAAVGGALAYAFKLIRI